MNRLSFALAAVLVALVSFSSSASALGFSGGGGRLGYLDPEFGDGGVAVGAHVELESPGSHWHVQPNVLYWSGDPLSGFAGNLDAFYHFGAQARTSPYLGAGLGFSMVDLPNNGGSETDPAVNLFGGMMFPSGSNSFFIEGRHTLSDVDQTSISFGITLR